MAGLLYGPYKKVSAIYVSMKLILFDFIDWDLAASELGLHIDGHERSVIEWYNETDNGGEFHTTN